MSFLVLGINHTTAPVQLRERVAFAPERLEQALGEVTALPGVHGAAILSTCNRTELYCELGGANVGLLVEWLSDYHRLSPKELGTYVYNYPGQEAVHHILRVASGLDSMILGEPQILGQMKEAYHAATRAGTLGPLLGRLFQHTFLVAKQIRTDTAIGSSPVSVAFAAVSLAKQIFGQLAEQTALLVGAGETIELAARHLYDNQIGRIIVANRTVERAHDLAGQFGGYAISLAEITAHLEEADIVIASTAGREPIVSSAMVERALKKRKHRPIFMVDIAVPRDIEPAVDRLDDVYLYTVDDLKDVIEENLQSRREAARQADEIVDVQVAHFMGWVRSRDAVDAICAYRGRAERTRDEVLEKALHMFDQGRPADEVLRFLGHTLTNKLIHHPCANLKQAAAQGRTELIRAAQELLELEEECPEEQEPTARLSGATGTASGKS
ncbi:MAG: glutamyl-tRNA reductase [Gammaproteobacteria bacterium]|nr:glutamyl-tRNA reductase [Gammaproteobacteria bacterium]NIR98648.1 glutamyl-tRNA reductase [Gammaproteobacteria bacterium]NIT64365.1 glutamyl-tRNA reductase [Gammaproteobacteria bacterium]NIV21297.1 glutamyl-tRNA reductase [Gammaproteobacteria bacterium]NIY32945.1 glutamyl-tRNA reductase [Gammaproteobacteria bacterium]